MGELTQQRLQLVLVILPDNGTARYAQVKRVRSSSKRPMELDFVMVQSSG